MRAIFVRHGHLFDACAFEAILNQSVIPSVKLGATTDTSTCVGLFSPSPLENNFTFLQSGPALPPAADDDYLVECANNAQSEGSSAERELGVAEALIEAAHRDLRLGGDGSLEKNQKGHEELRRNSSFYKEENDDENIGDVTMALEDIVEIHNLPSDSYIANTGE